MHKVSWGDRSSVLFHMLDRVNDFIDQFHGDPRNDALSLGECTLERAEGYSCLLGGHAREKLIENSGRQPGLLPVATQSR